MKPIDEVVAFFERRVEAAPASFLDRTQLGIALAEQARERADLALYEDSEAVLRESLRLNPDSNTTKLAMGRVLHSQHRFSEARTIANEVWLAEPRSNGALALLGDANFELGEYAVAEDLFHRLADDERSAPVVSRLARLAYAIGDPDAAVALAEEALELSRAIVLRPGEVSFYWFQLGHLRFVTGDVHGAVAVLKTALELDPTDPGASEELAFVYASVGRPADAEAIYRQLLERGPAADIHGAYADLLRARGAEEEAGEQERLGRLLARDTIDRYPAERRHLARFYLSRDSALAVELAEADLADRADFGAYDTLAWALYHDGQFAQAAETIEDALAVGTLDPALLYHAGAIALANGEDSEAESYLREALSINPRFDPFDATDAAALLAGVEDRLGQSASRMYRGPGPRSPA
jgi:tetratricopeptide (TPR) repeat protein